MHHKLIFLSFFIFLGFAPLSGQQLEWKPDSVQLNLGYVFTPRAQNINAITTVKASNFNNGPIYQSEQLWQGMVPGLTVSRPGSDPNEAYNSRLRTLRTLNLNTQPVYVIDGIPGLPLESIDPQDIETVTVLRDAASAAIYGGRAGSGVILITTKGKAKKGFSVQYDGQLSYEKIAKRYTVWDESQYTAFSPGVDFDPTTLTNTDWQSEVTRPALSHMHHLSIVHTRKDDGFVRANFHYRKVNGILQNSDFTQLNGLLTFSEPIWKNRIRFYGTFGVRSKDGSPGHPESFRYAVTANPSWPVRSNLPQFESTGGFVGFSLFDQFNPVAINALTFNNTTQTNFLALGGVELKIARGLSLHLRRSLNTLNSKFREYGTNQNLYRPSQLRVDLYNNDYDYTEAFGQWTKKIKGLEFNMMGGYSWSSEDVYTYSGNGMVPNASTESYNIDVDTAALTPTYSPRKYGHTATAIGMFGRVNLGWKDMLYVTASLRRDGNSKFGRNNEWANFPSVSGGVNLGTILDLPYITHLTVRGGYGVVGNAPGLGYNDLIRFANGPAFYYNGSYVPSAVFSQWTNPDLGWEKTRETNFGFDFAIRNDKLRGSVDFFRSNSDQLQQLIQNTSNNLFLPTWQNTGALKGRGFELQVDAEVVEKQNFAWRIGLTMSKSVTKLTKYGLENDSIQFGFPGAPCGCGTFYSILYPGMNIGDFWGPVTNGELDANGNYIYQNIDKDPNINIEDYRKDQTLIANGLPKWQYGINQHLRWKNFGLTLMLRGATGYQLAHEMRLFYESGFLGGSNKVQTKYYDINAKSFNRLSNLYYEKANFLRLHQAALQYKLPDFSRFLDNITLEIGGQNLLTITRYTGLDPDVRLAAATEQANGNYSTANEQPLLPGVDRRSTYPLARGFWVGIKAAF